MEEFKDNEETNSKEGNGQTGKDWNASKRKKKGVEPQPVEKLGGTGAHRSITTMVPGK